MNDLHRLAQLLAYLGIIAIAVVFCLEATGAI